MTNNQWRIWDRDDSVEMRTYKRATGELPEMECTKQLVRLVASVYRKGDRVLDVGCAAGHYFNGLKRLDPMITYHDVDATQRYIEFANQHFADERNATFSRGDILFLSDAVGSDFDIVFCGNVILHLPPSAEVPIRNLIEASKKHVIIRCLISDQTHLSKALYADDFDASGEPTNYAYQNTYSYDHIRRCVANVGDYCVRFVDDEFDAAQINAEYDRYQTVQSAVTRVSDGLQIAGSKVFEWKWVVITKIPSGPFSIHDLT